MIKITHLVLLATSTARLWAAWAYQWPSAHYDALEAELFEGAAPDTQIISILANNCQGRTGQPNASPVAAEWVRFAYHDMSTHNIEDGTGGMDASIRYELDREENIGQGMKDTFFHDFIMFKTKYVSYADVIAMGVVWGVSACGGPIIPFRGGRIDSLAAGPLGVPEPHQDIATHTEKFRLQGFNQAEMISLVACGHTLGAVRSTDFPDIVPPNPSEPWTVFGPFDGTAKFDHSVVSQYLDGTTKNPLVVGNNKTRTSDSRIFGSDRNETIATLNSAQSYAATCSSMLERMINTVPRGVELTEEIRLIPAKVSWARIHWEKQLLFNVAFRLAIPHDPASDTPAPNKLVKLFWCDRRGDAANCSNHKAHAAAESTVDNPTSPVVAAMKVALQVYEFTVPISSNLSVSKFWFEVDDLGGNGQNVVKYDNGGGGYILPQDEVTYLPFLSGRADQDYLLVAGVRNEVAPSSVRMIATGLIARDSAGVKQTLDLQPYSSPSAPVVDGYSLYSTTLTKPPSQVTLDTEAVINGISYVDDFRPAIKIIDFPKLVSSVSEVDISG